MQGFPASGESFERSARYYDEVRPGYPHELVEEVIRFTRIEDKARILEIGCGTGQATILFARKGYEMLCLDIGENLIALAKERCKDYARVKFLSLFRRLGARCQAIRPSHLRHSVSLDKAGNRIPKGRQCVSKRRAYRPLLESPLIPL